MYMHQKNVRKMENSLFAIFDKIWPMTMYYSTPCADHKFSGTVYETVYNKSLPILKINDVTQ